MRPFADVCNKHELPVGRHDRQHLPHHHRPRRVALQATENTAVSETDMDDTLLTENVQTAAGQQTLSRQALDRGTGIEDVDDAGPVRAVRDHPRLTLINQATTGLAAVAPTTAYTDASPTARSCTRSSTPRWRASKRRCWGAVPSHAIMHSRRWYWLQSQVDLDWPLISSRASTPRPAAKNNGVPYAARVRGLLPNGMQVVVDNNLTTNNGAGTNEDVIYVVPPTSATCGRTRTPRCSSARSRPPRRASACCWSCTATSPTASGATATPCSRSPAPASSRPF
jgi:hypothetical protein